MKAKTIGCIIVTILIAGFYIVVCYGDDLGLITPINRTATPTPTIIIGVEETLKLYIPPSPVNGTVVNVAYDRLPSGEVITTNLTGGE
jgi:hypothetical protein